VRLGTGILVVAAASAGGCFDPVIPEGGACAGTDCPGDLVCVQGACVRAGAPDAAHTDGAVLDAVVAADALPGLCAPAADLVACWLFEADAADGSGHGLDLTAVNVTYGSGHAGLAATLGPTTDLRVADGPALAPPPELTWEAWIRADALPVAPARAGIIDKSYEFAAWLYPTFTCSFASISAVVDTGFVPAIGQWTHVACVQAGATGTAYVGGLAAGSVSTPARPDDPSALVIGANEPVGDHFTGAVDSVRVWRVARTPAELCAAAGC
jgi:hypothetical protein